MDGLRFTASYLVLHGAVKVVLVTAPLMEKLWAYPWMIAGLGGTGGVRYSGAGGDRARILAASPAQK
ncbi:hypothetical protein [Arthrobacter sp. AQ5-05]|uniref:hypothetical protein n=1 Tax=Arthrobacter sp. AQ5-05 TaxID=2184581 RepID=UPI0012B576A1|nr:hypothetical protein [Arthrobacter sp. AQ5-05]